MKEVTPSQLSSPSGALGVEEPPRAPGNHLLAALRIVAGPLLGTVIVRMASVP